MMIWRSYTTLRRSVQRIISVRKKYSSSLHLINEYKLSMNGRWRGKLSGT